MLSQTGVENISGIPAVLLKKSRRKDGSGSWRCNLSETLIGEYLVLPLTSRKMLQSEAFWMNNRFEEYWEWCAGGSYCLFSIRTRSGERLATLGLRKKRGYWQIDQCCGHSCTEVFEETSEYIDEDGIAHTEYWPTELYYVAHEVVRLMNSRALN